MCLDIIPPLFALILHSMSRGVCTGYTSVYRRASVLLPVSFYLSGCVYCSDCVSFYLIGCVYCSDCVSFYLSLCVYCSHCVSFYLVVCVHSSDRLFAGKNEDVTHMFGDEVQNKGRREMITFRLLDVDS